MNYETAMTSDDLMRTRDDPRSGWSTRTKLVIGLILLAALALVALLALSGEEESAFAADENQQAPTVTVIAPGRTSIEGRITSTGTLGARREMPVGVVGEGGRVISVPVEAGQWVRAGQVLAVIDSSVQGQQAQSSAAQIEVARADANLAQANLDRAAQLVERGFVSKADIDRLTATRDAAKARVRVAEAQYRELQARNARLNIVAPAAGLVLERNVEPGQVVSPGAGTLFSIAKGGEMEMLAKLGETDLATIAAGVTAEVVPAGSAKSFVGQVWQVSPIIDEQDRQGTVRIALAYASELRPGGFATATINSGTTVAPMLPESAILSDEQGSYVFVVGKGNKVERRGVETGMITRSGIVITKGLAGTEKVVMRAGGFLSVGDVVRPTAAQTAE